MLREAESDVVANSVVAICATHLDAAIRGTTRARESERVVDNLAIGHIEHAKAAGTSAAHVNKLIPRDHESRALNMNSSLARSRNAIVPNRDISHRGTKDIDAVTYVVCNCSDVAAADDRVSLDQNRSDVRCPRTRLNYDSVARCRELGVSRVDRVVNDPDVFDSIIGIVRLKIDGGYAGTAGLALRQKSIAFEDDIPAVDERQILGSHGGKKTVNDF